MIRKRASRILRTSDLRAGADVLHLLAVVAGHRLQGDAHGPATDRRTTPTCRMPTTAATWRWSTRGSRPTRFPVGTAPIPNRYMAHNGEINTLRGNRNWMFARQGMMSSPLFGADLEKVFPIIEPQCSDSGNFDNALGAPAARRPQPARSRDDDDPRGVAEAPDDARGESGRSTNTTRPCRSRGTGRRRSRFTDGNYIGAVLDRNGLRPSRYYITKDDKVVMASEVGVLAIDPERRQDQRPPAARTDVPGRLRKGPRSSTTASSSTKSPRGGPTANGSAGNGIVLDDLPQAPVPPHYTPPICSRGCRPSATRPRRWASCSSRCCTRRKIRSARWATTRRSSA